MTTNRLLENAPKKAGKVTTEMLHELAESLNGEWWVRHMGRRYGVSTDDKGRNYLSWVSVRAA